MLKLRGSTFLYSYIAAITMSSEFMSVVYVCIQICLHTKASIPIMLEL